MNNNQIKRKKVLDFAIEKGWKCNIETGQVFTHTGYLKHNISKEGYIKCTEIIDNKKVSFKAHQFIYYVATGIVSDVIDHLNGIKHDNRIINLHNGTQGENNQNDKTAKGYCWHKQHNKWLARITLNKKIINLGYFELEEEARQAYLNAKKIYHPKKAKLFI
jgi:hypothetical protein